MPRQQHGAWPNSEKGSTVLVMVCCTCYYIHVINRKLRSATEAWKDNKLHAREYRRRSVITQAIHVSNLARSWITLPNEQNDSRHACQIYKYCLGKINSVKRQRMTLWSYHACSLMFQRLVWFCYIAVTFQTKACSIYCSYLYLCDLWWLGQQNDCIYAGCSQATQRKTH